MKYFLLSLLLALVHVTAICCPCIENRKLETGKNTLSQEKRYIESDQILLLSDKIFVRVDDDLIIETQGIYKDAQGFYIDDDECDERFGYRWECVICHYCNPFWQKCCYRCDRDRKGDRCK